MTDPSALRGLGVVLSVLKAGQTFAVDDDGGGEVSEGPRLLG